MASFKWDDNLTPKLEAVKAKFPAAVLMFASTEAMRLENEMKQNRPWTDRTNNAKERLSARASKPEANVVRITLSHGVDYGKYLEFAHGRKYKIIEPTIKQNAPAIFARLNTIYNSVFYGG